MIYSLEGLVAEVSPTHTVIEVQGIGYWVGISLQTSQQLKKGTTTRIYTQQIIREDAHLLYGFYTLGEKEMFNLLISVNGVGAVSSLIMLSSLEIPEIANAIVNHNSALLQKAKGIGKKTAERIIVDLKDKVLKFVDEHQEITGLSNNKLKNEALTAIEVLGISRKQGEKLADKLLKEDPDINVETLVKKILKSI